MVLVLLIISCNHNTLMFTVRLQEVILIFLLEPTLEMFTVRLQEVIQIFLLETTLERFLLLCNHFLSSATGLRITLRSQRFYVISTTVTGNMITIKCVIIGQCLVPYMNQKCVNLL